ncbi:MAG: Rossmann-like domain protein [Planctomycetes bacterium ADurb.Bin126]|nr:MAG: Rossmann-like domain protein [Planctomycetes bacterium ADurb.Bin126]HOD83788.1 DUF2520 domain-containing protein [Phycisphaerae bacterium]
MHLCDLSILGPGHVGSTLAVLAGRANLRVAVGGRRIERARQAALHAGNHAVACTIDQAAAAGKLVLLTVGDPAIGPLCSDLARRGVWREGQIVAHCSGLLDSQVLAPARQAGCHVGSLHPLATFPTVSAAVETFDYTWCFVEGDEPAAAALEDLARRLGAARCLRLSEGRKPLYHASAVMACNYLATLLDAAEELARQAGVSDHQALAAMEGLVRSTVDNVLTLGPAAALTGPIARGDVQAVRIHLDSMADIDPTLVALYRQAGLRTIDLALKKGTINQAQAHALREVLSVD